jgi:hypothetical protein
MKKFLKNYSILSIALLAATASAAPLAKQGEYAEKIYTEYSLAAGGKIAFDVTERAHGNITDLRGRTFSHIVGMPSLLLTMSNFDGFVGTDLNYEKVGLDAYRVNDLTKSVDEFEKVGYPIKGGNYRLLDVVANLNGFHEIHQAIEFCWPAQSHCVLLEPTIEFADSIANSRTRLLAEGMGPKITTEPSNFVEGVTTRAGTCGLASNPSVIAKSISWPARTFSLYNAFGATLLTKWLGSVQSGVRCDTSCNVKPFGVANSSSGVGYVGYSVACAFNSTQATVGTTARFVGLSHCNHRYALGATAGITLAGGGTLSVSLSPSGNGTTTSNGGSYTDSCGRF